MTKPWSKSNMSGLKLRSSTLNETGTTPQAPAHSHTHYAWTNTATGVTNPIWKNNIRNGEDATTNLSCYECKVEKTEGHVEVKGWISHTHSPSAERHSYVSGDFDVNSWRGLFGSGSSVAPATNKADSTFYSKANNEIIAMEGGELLGELTKTVKEVKRLASNMTSLLFDWRRTMKRFKRTKWRQRANLVADSYLRWKFGWDPLVKDAQTLAGGLADDFVEVVPIEAFGKATVVDSKQFTNRSYTPFITCSDLLIFSEETTVKYKAGIRVTRYGIGGFRERLGLSPSNFLPTIYNLLPWTYMIDYFTNLGTMVEALGFDRARISWCNRTLRTTHIVESTCGLGYKLNAGFPNWDFAPGYPIVVPSKIRWATKVVQRTRTRPSVMPSLILKHPNFSTEAGRIQGVNIAAVLAARTWGASQVASRG